MALASLILNSALNAFTWVMVNSKLVFEGFILVYFIAVNSLYTFVYLASFFEIRRQHKRSFIDDYDQFNKSKLAPGVSLIIPAYNEKLHAIDSIRSYLGVKYPKFEVIVVNDGSTDKTLELLIEEFQLVKSYRLFRNDAKSKPITGFYVSKTHSNLFVVDKINGGKGEALNAGLNVARHPYFASLDADAFLENDALLRIMKPFFENPKDVIGCGGIIRIFNGCALKNGEVAEISLSNNPLVLFQINEYIRAFTAFRSGFGFLKCLPISSGAFSLFNTELAREIGGFDCTEIGEDFEMLIRMHRKMMDKKRKYEIKFCAYPICWTEVPDTLKGLSRQRNRWHRGLISVLHKHERMLFNPAYKAVGNFSLPFFVFCELAGPIVEAAGYFYILYSIFTGAFHSVFFLSFFLVAILWGALLSVLAVLYEEINFNWYKKWQHILTLLIFSVLENFSYRQFTVFWRLQGMLDYFRGDQSWGKIERHGFKISK